MTRNQATAIILSVEEVYPPIEQDSPDTLDLIHHLNLSLI